MQLRKTDRRRGTNQSDSVEPSTTDNLKKVAILHQNVQRFNKKVKVDVIKNYYRRHLGSVDFIFF